VAVQEKQAQHAKKRKQKREAAFVAGPETTTASKRSSLVKRGLSVMDLNYNSLNYKPLVRVHISAKCFYKS